MISKNLARRLERLETNVRRAEEKPIVFVIHAVDASRRVVGRFRVTPTGLQRLAPDEGHTTPDAARDEA